MCTIFMRVLNLSIDYVKFIPTPSDKTGHMINKKHQQKADEMAKTCLGLTDHQYRPQTAKCEIIRLKNRYLNKKEVNYINGEKQLKRM